MKRLATLLPVLLLAAAAARAAGLPDILDRGYVIATESGSHRGFRVFQGTGAGTNAVVYEWRCDSDPRFKTGYSLVSTAALKVRNGGRTVLVAGAADWAVVDTSGDAPRCIRSGTYPVGGDGGHAIDLLPDGTLVKGNSLSQTSGSIQLIRGDGTYKTASGLPFCHGVEWDENRECLWAIGFTNLIRFAYDAANLSLAEVRRYNLPNRGGHALELAANGKLYATDGYGVHRFDPDSESWTTLYRLTNAKCVSHSDAYGDVVELPTSDVYSDGYSANKVRVYPVSGDASNYYEVTPSPKSKMYRARWVSTQARAWTADLPRLGVLSPAVSNHVSVSFPVPVEAVGTAPATAKIVFAGKTVFTRTDVVSAGTLAASFAAKAPSTNSWEVSLVDAAGQSSNMRGSFVVPAPPAPALGEVAVAIADDRASATLSVEVSSVGVGPAALSLSVNGGPAWSQDGVAAPGTFSATVPVASGGSYGYAFSLSDSYGQTAAANGSFDVPELPVPAFGPATAVVADDGKSATLSVSLLAVGTPPATVSLSFDGAPLATWTGVSAPATFSTNVAVSAGESHAFAFSASDRFAQTASAAGFFTASTLDGWFDVRFEDPGYAAGTDWWRDLSAVYEPGGSWRVSDGLSRLADATASAPRRVEMGGTEGIVYEPVSPSEDGADVTVRGRLRLSASNDPPPAPGRGDFGGLAFVFGEDGAIVPLGYAGGGEWFAFDAPAEPLVFDAWYDWAADFDFSSESAPAVRCRLGGAPLLRGGAAWIPLSFSPGRVSSVSFAGDGALGGFRGVYASRVVGEPVVPAFGGGAPLALAGSGGSATFSMTVVNAVEGCWYTAFAASSLDGPFVAESDATQAGADATLVLSVSAGPSVRFVRVVASKRPFSAGDPLPASLLSAPQSTGTDPVRP